MPSDRSAEGLKQVIGVPGLTLGIVNGMVGAGIFVLPAIVGIELGAFSLFSYLFCSVMIASIMLCYAEIGSRVKSSGGSYAYVESAFGPFAGYLVNWLYFFAWSVLGSAALMNVIADSLAVSYPLFHAAWFRSVFFLLLISFITCINIVGARQSNAMVKLVTVIKLLPLLAIAFFGLSLVKVSNLYWEHAPSLGSFGQATLVLFFAFAGFENSLGASGEFKNPGRTVPLSIFLGGGLVLVLYILLQTVGQGVLGGQMAQYQSAPLAEIGKRLFGPAVANLLLFAAAISCFGNVSSDILATPRSFFAGAQHGTFPRYLGKVHARYATPHFAVITYAGLIYLFSISGGFRQLASLASTAILLVYLAVVLATLRSRKRAVKEGTRVFRAPGGWLTPLIGIASICWLLSSLGRKEIIASLFFLGAIMLIYASTKWISKKAGAPVSTPGGDSSL